MRILALILLLAVSSIHVAYAGSPEERALAWVQAQREVALKAVSTALSRLAVEESNLASSRKLESELSVGKDAQALAIIREAVVVNERGVKEAALGLQRAKSWLSREERTIRLLKNMLTTGQAHRAIALSAEGDVRQCRANGSTYEEQNNVMSLQAGESLKVGPGGKARLFLAGSNTDVLLLQNSDFTLVSDDDMNGVEALLSRGFARIRHMAKSYSKKFEVRTPTVAVAVRGTDFVIQELSTETRVSVIEGLVQVKTVDGGDGVDVHPGEGCMLQHGDNTLVVNKMETWPPEFGDVP